MQSVKKKSSLLAVILGLLTGVFVALYFGWRSFVAVLLTVIIVVIFITFYFDFDMPGWIYFNMIFFGIWGYFLSKHYNNELYDTYIYKGPFLLCRMYVLLNIGIMFLISIINDLSEGYYGLAALDFFLFMPAAAFIFTKAISFIVIVISSVGEGDDSQGVNKKYFIDHENGTIPIGDLPIGTLVVDPGWEWEYRLVFNYSDISWDTGELCPDEVKPVTWIVVAKDHYKGLTPHVTLLSEELIGFFTFDNSEDRAIQRGTGSNHWSNSGTTNAYRGLRPWLNSTGIHSGEGFYQAFSESFKSAVLNTTLPNKEWENGNAYITQDKVFIPSTTELGDKKHNRTYRIGSNYPYFLIADDIKRSALLGVDDQWYWTRSPDSESAGKEVRSIHFLAPFNSNRADSDLPGEGGVRPALNLKSDTMVSEI